MGERGETIEIASIVLNIVSDSIAGLSISLFSLYERGTLLLVSIRLIVLIS